MVSIHFFQESHHRHHNKRHGDDTHQHHHGHHQPHGHYSQDSRSPPAGLSLPSSAFLTSRLRRSFHKSESRLFGAPQPSTSGYRSQPQMKGHATPAQGSPSPPSSTSGGLGPRSQSRTTLMPGALPGFLAPPMAPLLVEENASSASLASRPRSCSGSTVCLRGRAPTQDNTKEH